MISQFQNLMSKREAVIPANWISSALLLGRPPTCQQIASLARDECGGRG
ncbi:MAG TPA: hypothetical protein VLZ12_02920 [Verrucomicrobiae bacterium]|nr:hypothetical protein [Verrucomicrobiae bacterium]